MNRIFKPHLLFCAIALLASVPATAIPIDTVPVGNPGNAPDQDFGEGQFGAVAYNYRIGTYEVTNAQYVEFLNAKDETGANSLELYSSSMTSDALGGINFTAGNANGLKFSVTTHMDNKPVNFVSFYDAIRFANWLNNGQGTGDTETGAYTLANGQSVTRNAGATWFLPSENEWYKAAYHDPRTASQGGPDGDDNYWLYPTTSDAEPTQATANSVGDISNPGANVANYLDGADWNGQDGNVTTVGSAGPLSASYYGTADQGGNVWEYNETSFFGGLYRGERGSGFSGLALYLAASDRAHIPAETHEGYDSLGFRVASIPEPTSLVLLALGLPLIVRHSRRSGSGGVRAHYQFALAPATRALAVARSDR